MLLHQHNRIFQLLHMHKAFSTVIQIHGTAAVSVFPIYQGFMCKSNEVRAISLRSQNSGIRFAHFSTKNQSADQQPPEFKISKKLPDILQQQCKNWIHALWAEQKAKDAKQIWKNCSLKCTNVVTTTNTSDLTMSLEDLTNESKQVFKRFFTISESVLIRPFVKCPWQEDITGVLKKHLFDRNGNVTVAIIYVRRKFNREEQDQIKHFLDQSQLKALCAVQNLNRPIVAVHGSPGTGKTMSLVRSIQQFKKQASILRLFGNPDGSGAPVSSDEAHKIGFGKSLLTRMDEEFGEEVNFHLRQQYRSAPTIQKWPARVFYGQRAAEPDKSVKNIHLEDLLVPGAQLITDPFVLVDLNKLEGEWKPTMFKPEMGGFSFFNFCEALLIAEHLRKLFENLQQCDTSKIAYFTQYEAQRIEIQNIFRCFFPSQLANLEKVRLKDIEMDGQSSEVVLQSFVSDDRARTLLSTPFHLKALALQMTRAKRQYMLFAKSEWLEEGSDESRQLLNTFRIHGRIIGPNDLFKLKHHTQIFDIKLQIMKMVRKMQYADYKKKNPKLFK